MKYHWIITSIFFVTSFIFADDVIDTQDIVEKTHSTTLIPESASVSVTPQYDNRLGFSGCRLIYERIKNDNFYFGLDVWTAWAINPVRNHDYSALIEGEARIGYNLFYYDRDHFTPLAGVGYLYHDVGAFYHAKFGYVTAGFKYSHEFNTIFEWGLHAKALAGQQLSGYAPKKFAWGVDVCMPFTFHFARRRHWDITLEPGYLYIESHHRHQSVFLIHSSVGYRF